MAQIPRHTNRGLLAWVALPLLILSSCTQTRLTHFNNHDFDPVYRAELSNVARVAVDSCASGIHALLVLELQPAQQSTSQQRIIEPIEPLPLTLEYGNGHAAGVRFGRLEGPICFKASTWNDERLYGPPSADELSCSFLYTAQFTLHQIPKAGDDLRLKYNGRSILLAQR